MTNKSTAKVFMCDCTGEGVMVTVEKRISLKIQTDIPTLD